jgi:hypothetical protein
MLLVAAKFGTFQKAFCMRYFAYLTLGLPIVDSKVEARGQIHGPQLENIVDSGPAN